MSENANHRGINSYVRVPVRSKRKGQTAIEYLLVTASLLIVFVMMYKALQYSLANQFKRGGMVIIKMYKEDPW